MTGNSSQIRVARAVRPAVLSAVLACGGVVHAADSRAADTLPLDASAMAGVASQVGRSLVVVEHWLRYDKGQRPDLPYDLDAAGPATRRWHGDGDDLVREERPLETSGFLVGGKRVVTNDLALHERFVERLTVRYGSARVAATVAGWATQHDAVVLALEDTLAGAVPLAFDSADTSGLLVVRYGRMQGLWQVGVSALGAPVVVDTLDTAMMVARRTLVVDRKGHAAGLLMDGRMGLDSLWRGSPLRWKAISQSERRSAIERVQRCAEDALVHVELSFRSPRSKGGEQMNEWRQARYRDENMSATEAHAVGVCLENRRVLVLAELTAEATARLERIVVYDAAGKAREARFEATLRDFGALLATLEKRGPAELKLSGVPLIDTRNRLVLRAQVSMAGKQRIAFYWHGRVRELEPGYRNHLYPSLSGPNEEDVFLFSLEGELLALPLSLRSRATASRDDSWYGQKAPTAPVALLAPVLHDVRAHADSSSVPLGEEQEGRLAWMGVVLQPLDRELARANGVAEQTQDGTSGAIVSYVYEGSPADKAGIEPDMVLLRLNPEGFPRPVNVTLDGPAWDEPFPWEQLDDIPEDLLERIPPPWPSADDAFARLLTELGFGRKYRADFVSDGREFSKDFAVVEGPSHYSSAHKHRDEKLGLTVRDMTFEVRRHFRKSTDDAGVVVSRVEPGSRASVAGIKPYELITHLDGHLVRSAADFEKISPRADEVRLSVERLGRSRQVRITLDGS